MHERTQKTFEEHCEFVEDLCRICFYTAYKFQEKLPDKSLGDVLREHTPFYYHALELEQNAILPGFEILKADSAEEFEEKMWDQIRNLALHRAARYYKSSVGMSIPMYFNCGSLRYDKPLPGLPPNYCNFHIANAIAPRSIFDDPDYLAGCLLELIKRSSAEYGFDTLRTSTWLSDNERFLAYFPQSWRDNRKIQVCIEDHPEIPGWAFGNWGQVITCRGTFNRKMGAYIRENLSMKYKTYSSFCSFAELKLHLEEKRYAQHA